MLQMLGRGAVLSGACAEQREEMISKWTPLPAGVWVFEWTTGWMGIKRTPVACGVAQTREGEVRSSEDTVRAHDVMTDYAPPCGIPFPARPKKTVNRSRPW